MDAVGTWEAGEPRVRVLRMTGARHRLAAGHRRAAARVRRRPLRGVTARPTLASAATRRSKAYVAASVAAVRSVAARARPDAALANHLVMGPLIVARALGEGGALRREDPRQRARGCVVSATERFLPATAKGSPPGTRRSSAARGTRRRACGRRWATTSCLRARAWARPASTCTEFRPRPRRKGRPSASASSRSACRQRSRRTARGSRRSAATSRPRGARWPPGPGARPPRGLHRQADRLQGRGPARGRVAALVLRDVPDARLVVVGFGAFRDALERLLGALQAGDLAVAREMRSPATEGDPRAAAPPARLPGSAWPPATRAWRATARRQPGCASVSC